MTPEQKSALIYSQTALFNAEIEGMKAENTHTMNCQDRIVYGNDQFAGVIKKWEPVIGYNAVLKLFNDEF